MIAIEQSMTEIGSSPGWGEFINRIRKYAHEAEDQERNARSAVERLVWAKWNLGKTVRTYHEQNDRLGAYGDRIAERVAHELSNDPGRPDFAISKREVERCVKFARDHPTQETVKLLLQDGKNWKQIREGVKDDSPEGQKEKEENAVGVSLWSDSRLRAYVENGVPPEHLEEVTGHLRSKVENDFDMLRMVDDQAVIEIATPVSQSPSSGLDHRNTLDVSGTILRVESWSTGIYDAFQKFLRTQPCIVCGRPDADDLFGMHSHHWPRTKGAGGEDWQQVPCCGKCHTEYHSQGWNHIEETKVIRELMKRYAQAVVAVLNMHRESENRTEARQVSEFDGTMVDDLPDTGESSSSNEC